MRVKKTTNACPLSTTILLALITVALRIYAHLFLMTSVLLLSQLLPFENTGVDKHAAQHWLSTFLFASKVPLLTSGMHRHCRFVKEVPLCVCFTVSTRRPSNNNFTQDVGLYMTKLQALLLKRNLKRI